MTNPRIAEPSKAAIEAACQHLVMSSDESEYSKFRRQVTDGLRAAYAVDSLTRSLDWAVSQELTVERLAVLLADGITRRPIKNCTINIQEIKALAAWLRPRLAGA